LAWKNRGKIRSSLLSLVEAEPGHIPECQSLAAAKLLCRQAGLITLPSAEMTEFCNSPGWQISVGTDKTLVFDIKRQTFILSSQRSFRLRIEGFFMLSVIKYLYILREVYFEIFDTYNGSPY
jgi:hypothetical protein